MNKKLTLVLSLISCVAIAGGLTAAALMNGGNKIKLQATGSEYTVIFNNFQLAGLDGNKNYWSNTSERGYKLGLHINGSAQFYQGTTTLDPDMDNYMTTEDVTGNESQRKYNFSGSLITSVQVTFSGSGTLKVYYDGGNYDFSASDETKDLNNSSFFALVPRSNTVTISSVTVTYSCK